MERRSFIGGVLAGGALLGNSTCFFGASTVHAKQSNYMMFTDDLIIERDVSGKPYKGKVLAAIQPHADDIPIFAGGLVAKLIKEGYTGYLINTTNDDHAGPGTVGDTVLTNERDWDKVANALGLKKVFNLGYRNHRMEDIDVIEMKARLIFLFRTLKIDTVIGFDPWGHYEENPDHWVSGRVVEEACWMSGMDNDYPEHMLVDVGLEPHPVRERYYYVGRPGQPFNRVVDISSTIEQKIQAIAECKSQGGGKRGSQLMARLAKEGKKLLILGNNDETADREYVRHFLINEYKRLGEEYELEYAERFYYIDQRRPEGKSEIDKYIEENAVKI